MTWVRLEDNSVWHPKFRQVGYKGWALFTASLVHASAYLTDGFIATAVLPGLLPDLPTPKKVAAALVDARLWEVATGGYQIHDYHDYQPTADAVKAGRDRKRDIDRDRQRRHRDNHRDNGVTERDSPRDISVTDRDVTLPPYPSRTHPDTTTATNVAAAVEPPPEIPEWLCVLGELQRPQPEDIRRLVGWAATHDPILLRETAYVLVQKWPDYVAKPHNKNRKPFSTFQAWVKLEESRRASNMKGDRNGVNRDNTASGSKPAEDKWERDRREHDERKTRLRGNF